MILWSVRGHGAVDVNGCRERLLPGEFLFFPWRHAISYRPDASDPFYVGGVHIIPDFKGGPPEVYSVRHSRTQDLPEDPERSDLEVEELQRFLHGDFERAPALQWILQYVVAWFTRGGFSLYSAQNLGAALLEEISLFARSAAIPDRPVPGNLRSLTQYITSQPGAQLDLSSLSKMSRCSPSTIHRLFMKFLDCSPGQYVLRSRIDAAKALLTETRLPINEVAGRVGFHDPYHFSRIFKKTTGQTASHFRRSTAMV